MGFTSIDNWLNDITSGQFVRTDWIKATATGPYVIGRWYDLSTSLGYPPTNVYGELTVNGAPTGSGWGWTDVGSGGWAYVSTPNFTHTAGTSGNISQPSMSITNGRYYQLTWTVAYTSGTSITPSLNGTNGTARSSSNTFVEIIGPVGSSGGLVITPTSNFQGSVSAISVIEVTSGGAPMSHVMNDALPAGAMYHGGNVSPSTKHIINAGVISPQSGATAVPSVLMLCDYLLSYPLINANTGSSQTLTTTNTLPRYTTGVGVRAFVVATGTVGVTGTAAVPTATLGATAMTPLVISYTDQAGNSSHSMPFSNVLANNPVSSVAGTIIHSAAAINGYGPFLPLAAGDTGMRSVQSIQMAASGTANTTCALVLAKPLFSIPLSAVGVLSERDLMNQLPSMPQVYDGACLGWLYYAGAATVVNMPFNGYIDFCYG